MRTDATSQVRAHLYLYNMYTVYTKIKHVNRLRFWPRKDNYVRWIEFFFLNTKLIIIGVIHLSIKNHKNENRYTLYVWYEKYYIDLRAYFAWLHCSSWKNTMEYIILYIITVALGKNSKKKLQITYRLDIFTLLAKRKYMRK